MMRGLRNHMSVIIQQALSLNPLCIGSSTVFTSNGDDEKCSSSETYPKNRLPGMLRIFPPAARRRLGNQILPHHRDSTSSPHQPPSVQPRPWPLLCLFPIRELHLHHDDFLMYVKLQKTASETENDWMLYATYDCHRPAARLSTISSG